MIGGFSVTHTFLKTLGESENNKLANILVSTKGNRNFLFINLCMDVFVRLNDNRNLQVPNDIEKLLLKMTIA